jgi:hypothetical protein
MRSVIRENCRSRIGQLLMVCAIGFTLICPSPSSTAAVIEGNPDIEDVNIRYHFVSLGDLYTDGRGKYLCVQVNHENFSLWNPLTGVLSPQSKNKCEIGSNLRQMSALVTSVSGEETNRSISSKDTSFGSDGSLSTDFESHNNCGQNFSNYFKLNQKGKQQNGFYIISRLKAPITISTEGQCNENESVTQYYDEVQMINSVYLGNDTTIIYSYQTRFVDPLILLVHKIPTSVWSSRNNVFIIPQHTLSQNLNGANDLLSRYKAVRLLIERLNETQGP